MKILEYLLANELEELFMIGDCSDNCLINTLSFFVFSFGTIFSTGAMELISTLVSSIFFSEDSSDMTEIATTMNDDCKKH